MEGLIGIVTEVCLYAFNVGFVFSMGGYIVRFLLDAAMGRVNRL